VLYKIFNSNTVKISSSCMSNLKQNIDGLNKSILHKKIVPLKTCNCRKPAECPMDRNCLKESVIYRATVTTEDKNPSHTYVGLTKNYFKTRYSNHKTSFFTANTSGIRKTISQSQNWLGKFLSKVLHITPLQIDVTYASGSLVYHLQT